MLVFSQVIFGGACANGFRALNCIWFGLEYRQSRDQSEGPIIFEMEKNPKNYILLVVLACFLLLGTVDSLCSQFGRFLPVVRTILQPTLSKTIVVTNRYYAFVRDVNGMVRFKTSAFCFPVVILCAL